MLVSVSVEVTEVIGVAAVIVWVRPAVVVAGTGVKTSVDTILLVPRQMEAQAA